MPLLVWPWYARFALSVGLPRTRALFEPMPFGVIVSGALLCALICTLNGIVSARATARGDIVKMVQDDDAFNVHPRAHTRRVMTVMYAVRVWAGTAALYFVIAHMPSIPATLTGNEQRLRLGIT